MTVLLLMYVRIEYLKDDRRTQQKESLKVGLKMDMKKKTHNVMFNNEVAGQQIIDQQRSNGENGEVHKPFLCTYIIIYLPIHPFIFFYIKGDSSRTNTNKKYGLQVS